MATAIRNLRRALRPLPTAAAAVIAATVLASTAMAAPPSTGSQNATWPTGGQNLDNSRSQPMETVIGTGNAGTLAPESGFGAGGRS